MPFVLNDVMKSIWRQNDVMPVRALSEQWFINQYKPLSLTLGYKGEVC